MDPKTQADLDNHANQKNENNDAYWQSRGYESRPDDWDDDDDDDKGSSGSYYDEENLAPDDLYDNQFEWSDLND